MQSTRIVTEVDNLLFPGVHYCRLWSPLEAMRFIYVDALKNKTLSQPPVYVFSDSEESDLDSNPDEYVYE